jgi:hypothetical protein
MKTPPREDDREVCAEKIDSGNDLETKPHSVGISTCTES